MMKSELEILVEQDMETLGYNPENEEDVRRFWELLLG